GAGLEDTRVDADVGELVDALGVTHDLEAEGAEGLVVVWVAFCGVAGAEVLALDRFDVGRRGEVGGDGVEKHLYALVLEGGATEHGGNLAAECGAADGELEFVGGEFVSVEEFL